MTRWTTPDSCWRSAAANCRKHSMTRRGRRSAACWSDYRRLAGRSNSARVLSFHPGWSTAALLLVGALGGIAGRAWYRETTLPLPGKPLMTVSAASRVSDHQLETMGVEDIRLEQQDGAAPRVELRLRSGQPTVVQGTPDDAEIRRVLAYVVQHGQQFDPGVRLDSLDALRAHTSDPQVLTALCDAAVRDSDPAVRLKALQALRTFGVDPAARQAMFEALAADDNSGVRVEAVDGLEAALAAPQRHTPAAGWPRTKHSPRPRAQRSE